jgi:hypothetical protein
VHLEAVVRNGAFPGGSRNRDEANCSLRHGGVVMETVVQVAQGQLQGSVENGLHIFKGVPFAASIDGANRFRAPQPRESWSGVRDATQVGLISRQAPLPPPFGTPLPEAGADCLNLNVWSPDVTGSLPVYVWIHQIGQVDDHRCIQVPPRPLDVASVRYEIVRYREGRDGRHFHFGRISN